MILGDSYITFNTKLTNFRGHYVPCKANLGNILSKSGQNLTFFRDRENLIGIG